MQLPNGCCGMQLRKKLESRVVDQVKKIADLQLALAESKAYLAALQDTLKLMPTQGEHITAVPVLRDGTDLAKVRNLLRTEGKHLHINDILKRLGKEVTRNNKAALGGSISTYVRKGHMFTRPAPNSFGLVEFEVQGGGHTEAEAEVEPPDDFGLVSSIPKKN